MSLEFVEPTSFTGDLAAAFLAIAEKKGDTCIYVDTQKFREQLVYKVFVHQEPNAIFDNENFVLENSKHYNAIFTYNKKILENCSNAIYCPFPAYSWISEAQWSSLNIGKKQFQISCLTGFKRMTEGHLFRQLLYYNQAVFQKAFGGNLVFFRSKDGHPLPEIGNNPFLGSEKFPLFETFQFSIVIENSSQPNYFTEKLIDCLITKTIPIYYGCPNIDEYFDTKGWILLEALDPTKRLEELYQKLQGISPDWYTQYESTIQKNYKTCIEKYRSMQQHIENAITKL